MSAKSFWQGHSIKGQKPDSNATITKPGSALLGPERVGIPKEAATRGLAARSQQVIDSRANLERVRNTGRMLGADNTDDEQDKASRAVDMAESGYKRQADESVRRVNKAKK